MQSMTGYGRARACRDGRDITIELKTVNHRFLDLSFRIPKNLAFLEDPLRSRINASGLTLEEYLAQDTSAASSTAESSSDSAAQ